MLGDSAVGLREGPVNPWRKVAGCKSLSELGTSKGLHHAGKDQDLGPVMPEFAGRLLHVDLGNIVCTAHLVGCQQ